MVDMTKLGEFGAQRSVPKSSGMDPTIGMSGLSKPDMSIQPTLGTVPVGAMNSPYANDWSYAGTSAPAGGGQMGGTESLGYGLNNSGFLFPASFDQSTAAMQRLGREKIAVPSAWTTGLGTLTPMAQTGMPTSSDEWWAATQDVTNRNINDAIKNAAEQAGLGGLRWSTPLGYTAQDIAGRQMGEAAQQWADRAMQAQEAARQRQLESTNQLFQYGQGQYQMSQDEMRRRMQAAQAGANNDMRKFQMAMQVFGLGNQMGFQNQDAQQQAINASYNNPYMNYANSWLQSQQQVPQTYQPSAFSNAAGAYTAANAMGGGGNAIFGQNQYGGGGFWQ